MMFRISTRRDAGGTVLRIEGRLDADGVRALKALRDQATEFLGMSTYIRQLVFEDCGQKREEENQ